MVICRFQKAMKGNAYKEDLSNPRHDHCLISLTFNN